MSDMYIIPDTGSALSNNDIAMLAGTDLLIEMMRNRITISATSLSDNQPRQAVTATGRWHTYLADVLAILESLNSTKFHFVENVNDSQIIRFWFEDRIDYENFRNELIAQKLTHTHDK
tara:strand:+ start:320 stop:673 length:354 start_codon:yes stop_codon:yes gene_type:complete